MLCILCCTPGALSTTLTLMYVVLQLLKERGSAMQTTNDRLHHQLASAESDNVALRADLANLLRTQQELVDSREKSRQLQLEADRRMARLETDVSDLSQQLMVGVQTPT